MISLTEEKVNKNSKARIAANNKYNEKAYDRINVAVPKGMKSEIGEHAKRIDGSVNSFVNRAIKETMERDKLLKNQMQPEKQIVISDVFKNIDDDYDGPAVYALIDDEGKKYIGATNELKTRLQFHATHIKILLRDSIDGFLNEKMKDAILHGRKFHVEILEKLPAGISKEELNNREYYYLEKEGGCNSTYNMRPIKLKQQPGDIME